MMFYIFSFGTEEMDHMEMITALVYKLIDGASLKDYEEAGWAGRVMKKKTFEIQ